MLEYKINIKNFVIISLSIPVFYPSLPAKVSPRKTRIEVNQTLSTRTQTRKTMYMRQGLRYARHRVKRACVETPRQGDAQLPVVKLAVLKCRPLPLGTSIASQKMPSKPENEHPHQHTRSPQSGCTAAHKCYSATRSLTTMLSHQSAQDISTLACVSTLKLQ